MAKRKQRQYVVVIETLECRHRFIAKGDTLLQATVYAANYAMSEWGDTVISFQVDELANPVL